jgi:hypothetical protein
VADEDGCFDLQPEMSKIPEIATKKPIRKSQIQAEHTRLERIQRALCMMPPESYIPILTMSPSWKLFMA